VTARERDRLALPVVALYWALLALGLGLYAAVVTTHAFVPIALGALIGTVLGQATALRNLRSWVVLVIVVLALYIGVPASPHGLDTDHFWMAFVPAAACAYASLAERWSLAAMWFPAMLWMLTILDRTRGVRELDAFGLGLLGVLAAAFFVFLRARETRRAALWRTAGAAPLALTRPPRLARELPARPLARATWSLVVTAAAFAVTVLVAPRMWRTESSRPRAARLDLPCCRADEDEAFDRSRVREYMDVGRGTDTGTDLWNDRRSCPNDAAGAVCALGEPYTGPAVEAEPIPLAAPGPIAVVPAPYEPVAPTPAQPSVRAGEGSLTPSKPFTPSPAAPAPAPAPRPSVREATPGPAPAAPPKATRRPAPPIADPPPPTPPPPVAPRPPPAPPAPAPAPPPSAHPPAPPPPPPAAAPHADMPASHIARRPDDDRGSHVLRYLALAVAGALGAQLLALLFRPIRRAFTLRHLRAPFWDETIDQRISNSWQLALIGLRDAGWRYDTGESPREFAQRVGVADLERCATILERARYGVGIADTDLTDMASSADAVYRDARGSVGPVARALAWLRRPLA
jgi:hypothetical protein